MESPINDSPLDSPSPQTKLTKKQLRMLEPEVEWVGMHKRTRKLTAYVVGDEIILRDGTKYVVGKDGNWIRNYDTPTVDSESGPGGGEASL